MQCYQHQNTPAVGLCKYCFKAVCPACAKTTPNGLACFDVCAQELGELADVVERNKKIYGIGRHSVRGPSTSVILWTLLSFLAWVYELFVYLYEDAFDGVIFFAVFCSVVAVISYISYRRTGIKC